MAQHSTAQHRAAGSRGQRQRHWPAAPASKAEGRAVWHASRPSSPRAHPSLSWRAVLCCAVSCAVLPNGAVTGLDIGFSNASLVHITMSFYTMCKSTTPIFLLAFAFMWGLET